VRVPLDAPDAADGAFDTVASAFGSAGPDALYDIVSARGGSKAAALAEDRLRRRDVLDRATPALRIAWALRQATCEEKPAWFERAGSEGDMRALILLEILRSARCNTRIGQCCFHHNALLDEATRTLHARLHKAP